MARRFESNSKKIPSVNIWRALAGFNVNCSNGKSIIIKKNELLFLLNIVGSFLIFKNEDGFKFGLHKTTLNFETIEKVFPDNG